MITIILPVFNAKRSLARALNSVIKQSIEDWECIIIDNNSSDGSVQIAEEFVSKDSRFSLLFCSEQGVAFARNMGLDRARGHFICFLDADDFFYPNSLEVRSRALLQSPDVIGVCSDYSIMKKRGKIRPRRRINKMKISVNDILTINEIPMLTAMVRASSIKNIRFVNKGHEDFIFWIQILSEGKFLNLPLETATYDASIKGISANKIRAARWHYDIMRSVVGFNRIQAWFRTGIYILRHLFRVVF